MLNSLQIVNKLFLKLKNLVIFCRIREYELEVRVSSSNLLMMLTILKKHSLFLYNILIDICAIDLLKNKNRFILIYNFLSPLFNQRLRCVLFVNSLVAIPSIIQLFKAADWLEREIWDMFGILFFGHPDLRRILTDYGFEGHPLCKDFPLTGFFDLYYDEIQQRLFYEKVVLFQKLRLFEFKQPWN